MINKLCLKFAAELKSAFKSVLYNKRQYAFFFVALFLIQTFCGVIVMSASVSNRVEKKVISEDYDYHVAIYDLNGDQLAHIKNGAMNAFNSGLYTAHYASHTGSDNRTLHDAFLFFNDSDPRVGYKLFSEKIMPEINALATYNTHFGRTTPLLSFYDRIADNNASYVFIALLLTVLSILLITALYNIRINNFKFDYGIYMTFGATYKKLVKTAFYELFAVSLITFLPAYFAAFITNTVIYLAAGVGFVFNFTSLFLMILMDLLIIGASVFLPMRTMSAQTPLSLIAAQDNSNLVTSPRRSFRFSEKAGRRLPRFIRMFPDGLELFGLWRFRKYILKTLMVAVAFCSVFVTGIYISEIVTHFNAAPKSEYTLTFADGYSCTAADARELLAIDGVTGVARRAETPALYVKSHVLIDDADVNPLSDLVAWSGTAVGRGINRYDGSFTASNSFVYTAADKNVIDDLVSGAVPYSFTGDPYKLLENDKYVIVTNSLGNSEKFSFEPGDRILVADFQSGDRPVDAYAQGKRRLTEELEYYKFKYDEYIICAVADGFATYDGAPIFMSEAAYMRSAKVNELAYTDCEIYADSSLSGAEVEAIYKELRNFAAYYSGSVTAVQNQAIAEAKLEAQKNTSGMIFAVALLVMFISPILWFFSQALFMKKREHEFDILSWFGAPAKSINRASKVSSVVLSITSTLFCVIMSYIFVFGVFKLVNNVLPFFTKSNVYCEFEMSATGLALGIAVSVVCACASTIIPVKQYLKNRKSADARAKSDS